MISLLHHTLIRNDISPGQLLNMVCFLYKCTHTGCLLFVMPWNQSLLPSQHFFWNSYFSSLLFISNYSISSDIKLWFHVLEHKTIHATVIFNIIIFEFNILLLASHVFFACNAFKYSSTKFSNSCKVLSVPLIKWLTEKQKLIKSFF